MCVNCVSSHNSENEQAKNRQGQFRFPESDHNITYRANYNISLQDTHMILAEMCVNCVVSQFLEYIVGVDLKHQISTKTSIGQALKKIYSMRWLASRCDD